MPDALIRECLVAKARGDDFPTIWQTILRQHPLVSGKPIQTLKQERPHLEVALVTGHWLIHDSARNEYRLWPARTRPPVD
jgi:hypothetical protein